MKNKQLFYLILLFCLGFQSVLKGQNERVGIIEHLQGNRSNNQGTVKIIQDPTIETLLYRHLNDVKYSKVQGYRIRIYAGIGSKGQKEWIKTRVKFEQKYALKTYPMFETPQYLLYVGDFRTRSEAYQYKKFIEKDFPAAFVVGPRDIEINYN
ncbi:MAG: hypothetical protein MI922_11490 [Bacteroidales bacterium]|nr:hypothetical protein [Bacteroidales bacterium]